MVDAVLRCHAGLDERTAPAAQDDGWAWLEAQSALAAATPGTVAELVLRVAPPPPSPEPLPTVLRTVAWLRLGGPLDGGWARGAESAYAWSLLLAPAPADRHDEWFLATSHRLSVGQLSDLLLGRNSLPAHPPVRHRARRTRKLDR